MCITVVPRFLESGYHSILEIRTSKIWTSSFRILKHKNPDIELFWYRSIPIGETCYLMPRYPNTQNPGYLCIRFKCGKISKTVWYWDQWITAIYFIWFWCHTFEFRLAWYNVCLSICLTKQLGALPSHVCSNSFWLYTLCAFWSTYI